MLIKIFDLIEFFRDIRKVAFEDYYDYGSFIRMCNFPYL